MVGFEELGSGRMAGGGGRSHVSTYMASTTAISHRCDDNGEDGWRHGRWLLSAKGLGDYEVESRYGGEGAGSKHGRDKSDGVSGWC